jgi:hypothetical protein
MENGTLTESEARFKYDEIVHRLFIKRDNKTLADSEESSILADLDILWYAMSEEDMAIVNEYSKQYATNYEFTELWLKEYDGKTSESM